MAERRYPEGQRWETGRGGGGEHRGGQMAAVAPEAKWADQGRKAQRTRVCMCVRVQCECERSVCAYTAIFTHPT